MQVTRIKHFAWCDRCLRGSPMQTFDAPLVARFFAIDELRGAGWVHVCDKALTAKAARQGAEQTWSGATYCPECAERARARARARGGSSGDVASGTSGTSVGGTGAPVAPVAPVERGAAARSRRSA